MCVRKKSFNALFKVAENRKWALILSYYSVAMHFIDFAHKKKELNILKQKHSAHFAINKKSNDAIYLSLFI